MKRVLTAVILIPIVVLALFRAPLWLFTLLVLGVALLAAKEYLGIMKAQGFRPMRITSYLLLTLLFAISYSVTWLFTSSPIGPIFGVALFPLFAICSPLIFLLFSLARDPISQALPDAAISYLLLPYVGFTLGLLPLLREFPDGPLYVLYLMLLVWCGDIAAYYVGRAIGRHKLAPRISPGKTWEGAVASVVAAVIVGFLLFHYINPIAAGFRNAHLLVEPVPDFSSPGYVPHTFLFAPLWFVAIFAVCINVAAQLGDLVESALKRGAGLKDSGSSLPGHGGVLDRIDALLFALPVGLVFGLLGMIGYFRMR
ncbi:MAG: phosphatidate cytidylyltransferase [Candidatus Korobacteraceae bacterium]